MKKTQNSTNGKPVMASSRILWLASICSVLCIAALNQAAAADITTGLVTHYEFNNNTTEADRRLRVMLIHPAEPVPGGAQNQINFDNVRFEMFKPIETGPFNETEPDSPQETSL